ncbi:MAG: DUF1080 domain-containing protein [Acidobacteria bacterium]|nr:DUF1080 domain-containing protein [Acidobacteriota bacterium]
MHRLLLLLCAGLCLAQQPPSAGSIPSGFTSIFNGRNIAGWHISMTNHHGRTREWRVFDGVLTATQDTPGDGGILLTDEKYRDFEIYLELKPDWGCDGGLFLRSSESGQAYQVKIDYLEGSDVGGIYGERLTGVEGTTADYRPYWKKDDWNTLLARIEGATPHITVWLNGQKITDWTDAANHAADGAADGHIALQVHGGRERWVEKGVHRFRNIAVRVLR